MEDTSTYFSREGCLKIDESHFKFPKSISTNFNLENGGVYTRLKSWEDKNNGPASRALDVIATRTAGRRRKSDVDRYIVRQIRRKY